MEPQLDAINRDLGQDPEALIRWALEQGPDRSSPPTSAPSRR